MTFLINKQNPKHFGNVLVKMQKYNLRKRKSTKKNRKPCSPNLFL